MVVVKETKVLSSARRVSIEEFLNSKQAVPQLQGRLRDYLEESKVDAKS